MNGYANLIAARLKKLADERSTGLLPVSGRGDGAIFFREGQVIYAESSRTSVPTARPPGLDALPLTPGSAPGTPGSPGFPDFPGPAAPGQAGTALAATTSVGRLTALLELTELIIDALTELLSSESRYAKFRPAQVLPAGEGRPMPVETVLAEVQRRHEIQRQLATVITSDTAVARDPSLEPPSAQVSPAQWSLITRAGSGATPRGLALQLGSSVFGTTIEVYRLVELGLLVAPGRSPAPAAGPAGGRPASALSFLGAVASGKGSDD